MPSKGNPVFRFRLTPGAYRDLAETIQRRNTWTRNPPWDVSTFIRQAIKEKIAKMARSRRPRPRRSRRSRTVVGQGAPLAEPGAIA